MNKEIYVVWCDGCDDEFFSTREKAKARCIDIITETLIDDRNEMYECLIELEGYDSADGVCGFYSAPLDEYDEDETDDIEPRPMKYHIYNAKYGSEPLCADDKAVEFDNCEAAKRFANSVIENTDFDMEDAYIKKDILYYDGGYIDATNLIVNEEEELEEVE
jgi:hypothetical protein